MKTLIKQLVQHKVNWITWILLVTIVILSCEKENLTEEPENVNAGPDQIIEYPQDSVVLMGSASNDPAGKFRYLWTKIKGPDSYAYDSYIITKPTSAETEAKHLSIGVYQFELKVTNKVGSYVKDTVQITVEPQVFLPTRCNNTDRPQVSAQLVPIGPIPESRSNITIAFTDTKIFFAGGINDKLSYPDNYSSRVDIYDIVTEEWSTDELSEGRYDIATITLGNSVFFAGGESIFEGPDTSILYSTLDIYDISTGNWSNTQLSEPRTSIATAAVGNKVFFISGDDGYGNPINIIDIYDMATNTWSTSSLSEARSHVSAISVNDKIYVAGGFKNGFSNPSDRIDIYNNANETLSTSSLSQPMGVMTGINLEQDIYWNSGCDVEIKDLTSWNSTMANLFESREDYAQRRRSVIVKDNKIVFLDNAYLGTDKFDIFDTTTGTWSIGILPQKVYQPIAVMVNNTIYLTGVDGQTKQSYLWKLEF